MLHCEGVACPYDSPFHATAWWPAGLNEPLQETLQAAHRPRKLLQQAEAVPGGLSHLGIRRACQLLRPILRAQVPRHARKLLCGAVYERPHRHQRPVHINTQQ